MVDRAPTKPNRYAVYDENHNFIRYEYHERADEPTQVGDALNKANLLPDAVATALGLTGNPQVKDALEKIKTLVDGNTTLANSKAQIATGSYTGTGTYGSGNKNSLPLDFVPKMVVLSTTSAEQGGKNRKSTLVLINPQTSFFTGTENGYQASYPMSVIWGTTFQWYGQDVYSHFNISGVVFNYFAIG